MVPHATPLRYESAQWAMVFPLRMYAAASEAAANQSESGRSV